MEGATKSVTDIETDAGKRHADFDSADDGFLSAVGFNPDMTFASFLNISCAI